MQNLFSRVELWIMRAQDRTIGTNDVVLNHTASGLGESQQPTGVREILLEPTLQAQFISQAKLSPKLC
jgi:hypothetical protein